MMEFTGEYIGELENEVADGKNVFLLIDNVQEEDASKEAWQCLLKTPTKIITIGFAGPSAEKPDPLLFGRIADASCFRLQSEELDDEVVQSFISMCQSANPQLVPPDASLTKEALETLLWYTRGHLYPFAKMSEYIFSKHANNILTKNVQEVYFQKGYIFQNTRVYNEIVQRCYALLPEYVFKTVYGTMINAEEEKVKEMDNFCLYENKDVLEISSFLINYCYLRMKP